MNNVMNDKKFTGNAFGRILLSLLFVSFMFSCGTTVVTDELLTPESTGKAYLPQLYPVMLERHDFKENFQLTKMEKKGNMADMYYDDVKTLFQRNFDLNYYNTGDGVYGYVRCDGADIKIKHDSWYFIPAILTATLCWTFGCPVVDAVATCQARFSVLDCEGNVVKTFAADGKGRSSGTMYVLGKDIARHASIKAYKEVLKELNKEIASDADMLTMLLNESAKNLAERQECAKAETARANPDYGLAVKLLNVNDNEGAVMLLSKVLADAPCHYLAHFFQGLAYMNMNQYSKALFGFRQASMLNPKFGDALYYQSYLLQRLRRSEEAYVPMLKAVEAQPENVNYRVLYAGLLEGDGRWTEAKKQYRRVLEINPDMVEVYDWIERVGQKEAAKVELEEQRSMQILDQQTRIMQVYTQAMTNMSNNVGVSGGGKINGGVTTGNHSGGRSRDSILRDLEDAKDLLGDMKRNQAANSSLVDKQIYNGMIQRQEQKIRELEAELRQHQ